MRQESCAPGIGMLRLFAGSWATMCALAGWWWAVRQPGSIGWLGLAVAALAFAGGLFWPTAMRGPYRLVERLLHPVGRIFAFVVLAAVYFLVFTPYALIFRVIGRDPLRLRSSHQGGSGWSDRRGPQVAQDYHWQY